MSDQSRVAPPQVSADGNWWWDGHRWVATASTNPAASAQEARGPSWARPWESPQGQGRLAVSFLAVTMVGAGLLSISFALVIVLPSTDLAAGSVAPKGPLVDLGVVLRIVGSLFYYGAWAGAAITFLMWLHRCYRNLPALGATELRFSPRWAVGWWFVPLANFVQPVRIVIEVWQASNAAQGQNTRAGRARLGTPLRIWLWWGLWVGSIVVLLSPGDTTNPALLAEIATEFGAAALAITVIRAITRFQVESSLLSPAVLSAGFRLSS